MIIEVSKGRQITIPADIRDEFELDKGSKLEIVKEGNKIVLRPISDDLGEMFKNAKSVKPKHNLNAKQMDELSERLFR